MEADIGGITPARESNGLEVLSADRQIRRRCCFNYVYDVEHGEAWKTAVWYLRVSLTFCLAQSQAGGEIKRQIFAVAGRRRVGSILKKAPLRQPYGIDFESQAFRNHPVTDASLDLMTGEIP
jgi:hypothetical protein